MSSKAAAAPPNRCLFSNRFFGIRAAFSLRAVAFLLLAPAFFFMPLKGHAAELRSPKKTLQVGTAQLIADDNHIAPGDDRFVFLSLDLPEGWHTYWKNPGDAGLAPILKPDLPAGAALGPIAWPLPEKILTEGFTNYGYGDEVLLPMPLHLDAGFSGLSLPVRLKADWLVCKDICLPQSAELNLDWPVRAAPHAERPAAFSAVLAKVPTLHEAAYNFDEHRLWAVISAPQPLPDQAPLFIATVNATKLEKEPQFLATTKGEALVFERGAVPVKNGFTFAGTSQGKPVEWTASYDPALAYPSAGPAGSPADPSTGLLWTLLLAFLGGLVLNVMPCVLPVLSLKVLSLMRKSTEDRRSALTESLFYALGIEVSFAAIGGLLLLLKQGGASLGWGFQMQEPVFVLLMALLTFGIGLMLSGVFGLPGLFGTAQHKLGARNHPLASFLTGVLATLVATPCTAPFMASAIGAGLTLPPTSAMLIFLSLGAGLAAPFLLVGLFPPLQRVLPKPGRWMETLKQLLAFPMYATTAWLVWVLSAEAGPLTLGLALMLLLGLGFVAWWSERLPRRGMRAALWSFALLGLVLALGHVPQMSLPTALRETNSFSEERLATLRRAGSPVLVDATADWCLTCKLNERLALSDTKVLQHFADTHLVLLTADWTRRDPDIARYLAGFGRSGVPAYIYYPPKGEPVLLPQLLTPAIVIAQTPDSGR